MTIEQSHELQDAILDEARARRLLRAHLPAWEAHTGDLTELTADQLSVVEEYLAAVQRRQRLLHPLVPTQPAGTPA